MLCLLLGKAGLAGCPAALRTHNLSRLLPCRRQALTDILVSKLEQLGQRAKLAGPGSAATQAALAPEL